MILPKIAAVATATPPHRFTQMQLLTMTGYTDATRRGFFDRSHIDGRDDDVHGTDQHVGCFVEYRPNTNIRSQPAHFTNPCSDAQSSQGVEEGGIAMNRAVTQLGGVLLGIALLLSVAGPRFAYGQMSWSGTTPGGAVFDRVDRLMTQPAPQVQAPTAPPAVDMWVPDRYVQTPQGDSFVVVPGHRERRLSDHEVYTPPFAGATPDGNVMNFSAAVRPASNERQAQ